MVNLLIVVFVNLGFVGILICLSNFLNIFCWFKFISGFFFVDYNQLVRYVLYLLICVCIYIKVNLILKLKVVNCDLLEIEFCFNDDLVVNN